MAIRTTAEVIDRFNHAFTGRDADALTDLIGADCVMESVQPAPTGERVEGGAACLAWWRALVEDRTTRFEPQEVIVAGERATIRWRYYFADGPAGWVEGVNLMRVRDGLIVEALGYSKTAGEVPLAAESGLDD
ncbi:nuclear transport factor 2 family protein [Nonomuraea rhodomycinica]|uniref:Nuclear transport factor 2 family protein n=1 Tax=Nonomuraea rhodomycinica TaxID=1712872 RepID=A0A7Y6M860_9ACTN|nr:nuclear transport factor 2 family protein [Nonomuraea rhodomycinica]NUW38763.1 nuclear transport factor 2 family protein [Nonomuraea rhodomycinica]